MTIRRKKAGKEMETAGMMRWLLTYADISPAFSHVHPALCYL